MWLQLFAPVRTYIFGTLPRFFIRFFSISETHEEHVIPFTLKNALAVRCAVSSSFFRGKMCPASSKNRQLQVGQKNLQKFGLENLTFSSSLRMTLKSYVPEWQILHSRRVILIDKLRAVLYSFIRGAPLAGAAGQIAPVVPSPNPPETGRALRKHCELFLVHLNKIHLPTH